jgi:hypothetical protein
LLELLKNIVDARSYSIASRPANNLTLEAISHKSQLNNAISFSERLNMHLNDEVHRYQTITLEQRFAQFEKQFATATDAERHRMLADLNTQLDQQEYHSSTAILDPPELNGKRTFGRGGSRRPTAAEIAEKELRRNDRDASRTQSATLASARVSKSSIIDLTTSNTSSRRPQGPIFMSFSNSGAVVRSSNISPLRQQGEDPEIVVLEAWSTEDVSAESNSPSENARQKQTSMSMTDVELPSDTSSSRPHRQISRRVIYDGSLVQPRKRVKR